MKNNDNELFRYSLKCQINMNLVFHISEDGTDIVIQRFLSISDWKVLNLRPRVYIHIRQAEKYTLGSRTMQLRMWRGLVGSSLQYISKLSLVPSISIIISSI